nr:MAG TPA: hypothetical protein [Caudoviricetes sp.]
MVDDEVLIRAGGENCTQSSTSQKFASWSINRQVKINPKA